MEQILHPTTVKILEIDPPEKTNKTVGKNEQLSGIIIGVKGGTVFFADGAYPPDILENYSNYRLVEMDLGSANRQEGEASRKTQYSFQLIANS